MTAGIAWGGGIIALVLLFGIIVAVALLPAIAISFSFALFIMFMCWFAAYMMFVRRRDPYIKVSQAENPTQAQRIMSEHDLATPFVIKAKGEQWAWRRIQSRFDDSDAIPPRTAVDRDLQKRLEVIDLPEHLLEPESILPSSHMGALTIGFLVGVYAFNGFVQTLQGNYWVAMIWLAVGAIWVAAVPSVRDRLRYFRFSEGKIIAGQGWIRDRRDRVWTTDDAMMIVSTYSGRPPMHIVVTGEAGVTKLSFMHERDPDFIKLWQRWNHPSPRPELAGG